MFRELLRLLTLTVEQRVAHEVPGMVRRLAFRLVAGIFLLAGFACLVTSLWIYLIPEVGPAGAPLVIAGLLFLMAVIFLILGRRRRVIVVAAAGPDPRMAASTAGFYPGGKAGLLAALFTAAFASGARR
jgi:hypothetical protein